MPKQIIRKNVYFVKSTRKQYFEISSFFVLTNCNSMYDNCYDPIVSFKTLFKDHVTLYTYMKVCPSKA